MSARVRSRDGTAIAYDRAGSGPPLILVDGALCSRAFGPMPKMAAALAPGFTVYTYDRRGRNESADTAPYDVRREVEDIEALIREAGGSAYLCGLSSGGALALEAAAAGLPIRKLALYEPPYVGGTNGKGPEPDHRARLEQILAQGRRGDAVTYFMVDMVGMPAFFGWIMRLMPMWSKLKAVAHTLPYDAAVMGSWSVPAATAARVKVPTLVIGGAKSPERLRTAVERTAAAVPGAEPKLLAGQTHNVSAQALAPVLTEFFN